MPAIDLRKQGNFLKRGLRTAPQVSPSFGRPYYRDLFITVKPKNMTGTVSLSFSPDGSLATLSLGSADERAITLTPERIKSFIEALEKVKAAKPKGLIVRSPNPDSFCVGADISLIQSVTEPDKGAALATQGQDAYNLLEDLPCTTVAAIGGPCVGGGCELVLACDYRIAADLTSTSIGLPETKLGILPGFGGTYRLPRVVGLPKALDMILAGKTLRAKQALKAGLVDQVTSSNNLYQLAQDLALGIKRAPKRKHALMDRFLTGNILGRALVSRGARKATLSQTKGFYPAPLKALDVTVEGLGRSRQPGLEVEAKKLGELIVTPESKALVHIFYLTEAAKAIGKSARKEIEGIHTLVVGAGTMGAGIAGTLARNNHQVIVKDTSDASLERGKAHTAKELAKLRHLSSFERQSINGKIDWLQFSSPTVARSKIVIEAVFEDINLKKRIFSDLSKQVDAQCVLATNTSSLSVTEMASTIDHPERFVGMHFFNPVEKMPLVEIIRGAKTSDATIAKVAALATEMGKFPIVVNDVPGFLVNRILIPYLNEAVFLLAEGYSVEQIDQAALKFGMPMGPIRLLDEVGLDVAAHVSKIMVAGYGDRMTVPDFAEQLMNVGRKGRKNGMGFYDYSRKKPVPWPGLSQALKLPTKAAGSLTEIQLADRLVLHLVNEAMKCLNEGVAGEDREIASKQIDLGTVMGIGFPPFRGGVLYYANKRGLDGIRAELEKLHDKLGSRYAPWGSY
jgi:3-hydroxyacyl-CoA dehydrogenase/enoyl-CoA hydratase/3-hydroxybutyryl-CoA epimerase